MLLLANQIAGNPIDFKMNIIKWNIIPQGASVAQSSEQAPFTSEIVSSILTSDY